METFTVTFAVLPAAIARCPERPVTVTFAATHVLVAFETEVETAVTVIATVFGLSSVSTRGRVFPGNRPDTLPAIEKVGVVVRGLAAPGTFGAPGAATSEPP